MENIKAKKLRITRLSKKPFFEFGRFVTHYATMN